ncbi:MAG: methylmalonyl-CoA mutase family protein [Brumimicrobium sp.]|nr:methylmalonyl-CoA mutase family protein [Brumimicrobium sp.]
MNDFFKEFPLVSEEEWKEQVARDLKGSEPEEILNQTDPIEEISFDSCGFPSKDHIREIPGKAPYTRGGKISDNEWDIINIIPSGTSQEMNKIILKRLMSGAAGLRIDLMEFENNDLEILFRDIQFNYITTTFICRNKTQIDKLVSIQKENPSMKGTLIWKGKGDYEKIEGFRDFLVDGTEVQRSGGNVSQEIAYVLHEGHKTLFQLLKDGEKIDDAIARIKFRTGIGGNYFFEIAKIKVIRKLWSKIVDAYQPEHDCSKVAYIEAETGLLNKSLKDPHTNLLRQTTEALSAVIGGVNELTIIPYDWKSTNPELSKTQRQATNIALMLKEESYLNKVIDPAGGAYVVENLITAIEQKSWEIFLRTEKEGLDFLGKSVRDTAKKRVNLLKNNENILIGVNKFPDPKASDSEWLNPSETAFGEELFLEAEFKKETV